MIKYKYPNDSLVPWKNIYMWLERIFSVSYLQKMQVFLKILCLSCNMNLFLEIFP